MRKINIICSALLLSIIFGACGSSTSSDSPSSDSQNSSYEAQKSQGQQESELPTGDQVHSRLTNQLIDSEISSKRPIAVIIPNEISSLPHYNISKASVLYEANVEGSMTRLMGIFEDWNDLDKIGNVRSLRTYFGYWAFEWDAVLVHYGGPYFIDELLALPTTQTLNGVESEAAFFRTDDRVAPHNAYTSGNLIENAMSAKKYSFNYRGLSDENHFIFADDNSPNTLSQYKDAAKDATYIDMSGCYPLTRSYFEYDSDKEIYYRSQYLSGGNDGPHIDAATNTQLSFTNIIVQYIKTEDLGEGYLSMQCMDSGMPGYYFTHGKCIPITWSKAEDYSATRYYDEQGNEIALNTGKTMICIVEEGSTFYYN